MSRVVWKTVLKVADVQEIKVPYGAELLCAREQHGDICVWFRCDPSHPEARRLIAVVGTGNLRPPAEGRYLGTAALHDGALMFHVFELAADNG